jgi:hypothetical protein
MLRSIPVAVALVAVLAVPGRAQEAPTLLAPEAIGEGWTLVAEQPPGDALPDAFTVAAYGAYGGPAGARVVVDVWLVAEGAAAIRQSWEITNATFDDYRSALYQGFDYSRERALESVRPPAGCSDVRRAEGVDIIGFGGFPLGMTLCAADDPPVIVLVIASGEVDGLAGREASDAVAESVLTAQSEASPTA